jgi:DNA relaxase NicK
MWKTWSAGVDWITATAKPGSPREDAVVSVALEALSQNVREGHTERLQSRLGYRGVQAAGVFLGQRHDGVMLQASGSVAHRVALRLREVDHKVKVTRLDFEVSLQDGSGTSNPVTAALEASEKARSAETGKRQGSYQLVRDHRRGSTFYAGSRASPRFGRIYDKSAEQRGKIEPNIWRWEIEHKGIVARRNWSAFVDAESPVRLAGAVVRATFDSKGIPMPEFDDGTEQRLVSTYEPTDTERQFAWLKTHVARTAQKLAETHGAERVATALGLKCWK